MKKSYHVTCGTLGNLCAGTQDTRRTTGLSVRAKCLISGDSCGSYLEEDQKTTEDQEIARLQDLIQRRTAILGPEHKLIIRLRADLEERSKAQKDPYPSTPLTLPFAWHMRFSDARESITDDISPKKGERKREIIIKIDPDYPDELILAGIKDYLRGYRKRIKHRKKRIPWNNLDEYLTIYDLKKARENRYRNSQGVVSYADRGLLIINWQTKCKEWL